MPRQTKLEKAGFKLIRFKDEQVLKELDIVKEKIIKTIKEIQG
jgi:very-short-patch-repair endonuclease